MFLLPRTTASVSSRRTRNAGRAAALVACVALLAAGCSEPSQQTQTTDPASTPGPDYNLSLNMSDFMLLVLEPAADAIWGAAGWIDDINEGYYELYPDDEEGWARVREQAAVVVEAGNAMMLPGRAPDQGAWFTYSQAMSTVGLTLMRALQDQDEEATFQAGAQLYSVCTACHQAYNPDILARFQVGGFTD